MAVPAADQPKTDERLLAENRLRKLLRRPELGAIGGAILVWLFFAIVAGRSGFLSLRGTANYLEVSAELGILAVAVSLLMIGGEFDLSVGSMIGATGMIIAILSVQYGWNIWAAIRRFAGRRAGDWRAQRLSGRPHETALVHHHARARCLSFGAAPLASRAC